MIHSLLPGIAVGNQSKKIKKFQQMLINGLGNYNSFTPCHGIIACRYYYKSGKVKTPTKFLDYSCTLNEYVSYIIKNKPERELFLFSGRHWSTGLVQCDEHTINILFLDSLPVYLNKRIKEVKSLLKDENVNIYYPNVRMQNDTHNCAVFALDNWRKLEKVNQYLPEKYNNDIINYLRCNSSLSYEKDDLRIFEAAIPIYLMKMMQTRRLINDILPERTEEQQISINKKNEDPYNTLVSYYRQYNGEPFINERVKTKRKKIIQKSKLFVSDIGNVKEIHEIMYKGASVSMQ